MHDPKPRSAGRDATDVPAGTDVAARLPWVDAVRGAALLGMVLFHLMRDLEMFGIVAPGTTLAGAWAVFARIVAGSFLLLAGVSLVLAHPDGVRWPAALRRILVIAAAAALVSLVTWVAMPGHFVYFGILHAIALFSFVGLTMVTAPAWMPALLAAGILAADALFGGCLALDAWLGWTGLAIAPRPALDLIPVMPWLAVTLAGVAMARAIDLRRFPRPSARTPAMRAAAWAGRNSLAVYLLHQPVLIGLLWLVLTAVR